MNKNVATAFQVLSTVAWLISIFCKDEYWLMAAIYLMVYAIYLNTLEKQL